MSAPYCQIEAFINTDEFDRIPDELEEWRYRQLVSVVMLDVERRLNPARAVWVAPFIGGMFAAMVAGLARL